MARIPRYGIHEGIKYNPKRTIVYSCEVCGKYSIKKARNDRYCNICKKNVNRQNKRNFDNKRMHDPERKEYMRELQSKLRGEQRIKETRENRGINICGKPPEQPTDQDWLVYHNKIKKMKKDTMGGYQDYHDIDDDHNPYE